jgi:hypothetical protein
MKQNISLDNTKSFWENCKWHILIVIISVLAGYASIAFFSKRDQAQAEKSVEAKAAINVSCLCRPLDFAGVD